MRARFEYHPIDIYACLAISAMIAILIYLEVEGAPRIVLGIPFIFLVPGYVFIFALFPEKPGRHRGIEPVERIALSLGMSIAIVPLIGLGLNYTPWGIRLEPILISLLGFVSATSVAGIYRWSRIEPSRRHAIEIQLASSSLGESTLDKALTIVLAISILAAIGALIWALTTPRIGESFTEFYLLGSGGMAGEYPTNLTLNQSPTVILGIQNHEYRNLTYHVEVWVINQTWKRETNATYYHWGVLLDSFYIALPHISIDVDQPWIPQWEKNYTLRIPVTGQNKVAFLLYKERPPSLPRSGEPADSTYKYGGRDIQERVEAAYRKIHLWIEVE